jgi:Ni/Co efflux regulator RcnB
MKTRHWYAAALAIALLVTTGAWAQEHRQFDEHDRQVAHNWYNQHQSHPSKGFRTQDRLSAEEEARLQPGKPFHPNLRKKAYSVPSDLRRQFPPPPPHHRYVAVGHHVALVNDINHVLVDVIRLRDENHH